MKEHTFPRALDNSREAKDVVDPRKNQRSYKKKIGFQSQLETKNGQNTHLQVSYGRTRGLEVLVGGRRVYRWRSVVGKWPTCQHVENTVEEENDAWRCIADWLMLEFLPTSRSSLGAPNGGVAGRIWSDRRKS